MAETKRHVSRPVRFGLIGCGAIGSLLDEERAGPFALTHAAAIGSTAAATLVAVCDTDARRAQQCAERRGVPTWFTSVLDLLHAVELDVVVLATPPEERIDVVRAVVAATVPVIWCEKPLATSLEESQQVAQLCQQAGTLLVVNHLRRWAPMFSAVAEALPTIGTVQSAVVRYTKGLANNGSHAIDLLLRWLGEVRRAERLRIVADERVGDATVDALVEFSGREPAPVAWLLGADHRAFQVLELDILGTEGRVRVLDSGRVVVVDRVVGDRDFPGYMRLEERVRLEGGLDGMFEAAAAHVVRLALGEDSGPDVSGADAVAVMAVVESLRA